jgi:hypothetical protein
MPKKYWIKWDCGYGDWGSSYQDLTKDQVIKKFNEITNNEYKTIEQCLNAEHACYSVHEGEAEFNANWMDS